MCSPLALHVGRAVAGSSLEDLCGRRPEQAICIRPGCWKPVIRERPLPGQEQG